MKLLSKKVIKEEWPWVYGESVFDDGMTVNWMKLHEDYKIGAKNDNNSKNH